MKRQIIIIKTADTKKEYSFKEGVTSKHPELWKVTMQIDCANRYTTLNYNHKSKSVATEIYVERETLVKAKMLPVAKEEDEHVKVAEKPEDLMLRLLECVGVYPES